MKKTTLLASTENAYRGRWVSEDLSYDISVFQAQLQFSLAVWQAEGIKVIWLTLSSDRSHLIPIAQELGFVFHHIAHNNGKSLVLTKRLVVNAIIPDYAHHTVGVGGIVTNQQAEVLVIVEKHDMQIRPGHYKFPGGAVDRGELLQDAVIREVMEETHIKTVFQGIVGFRHYHKGQFATSNLYFLCHLVAQSEHIIACEREIGLAQWMKISDYLSCASVMPFNKNMLEATLRGDYLKRRQIDQLMGLSANEYEIYD